jgi:ParB/RepB/Spo0J family partition protein
VPDAVTLLKSHDLQRNPDNPRLVFRQEDLDALQNSIAEQGILVPLTVYREGKGYRILDGERRWRCAIKLGLGSVPAILQPKPERMQNIMMMFAIHHARTDWDPLPTALKLRDLEQEFTKRNARGATESELAGLASLTRGEVRRLKKLLGLPESYRDELLKELDKPRSEQVLTVDHVLEATTAASLLKKRKIVDTDGEERLRRAIIEKFRSGVINNTTAPRKLAKLARAVGRNEIPIEQAKRVVSRLIAQPKYDIDRAFAESVEQIDFEHNIDQLASRVVSALEEHRQRGYQISPSLAEALDRLLHSLRVFLKG